MMRWISCVVAVCLLLGALFADGRGYEARTVPIYAGVVKLNPNDADVRDHYTFYVMERRNDVKPLGLTFINPYAPPNTNRSQRAYWEVDLSTIGETEITRYRVLLMSRASWKSITPEIIAKLRRFVDSGGVLWIEKAHLSTPPANANLSLFFPRVEFTRGSGPITRVNLNHPLLNGYYRLTPGEMARLGLRGRGQMEGRLTLFPEVSPVLQVVMADANAPVIAACTYGCGRIVVSAAGVASAINAPFVSSRDGSIVPQAREYLIENVPDLDLKFAYNIVRWAGSGSAPSVNMRGANALVDQYGAPLGIRWRNRNESLTPRDGAVVYGGLLFATIGNKLVCYDMQPNRDLDSDGRSDDGIPDLERGETYDKVWEAELSAQSSPPIIAETPSGLQVIVLVGTDVEGYWALPRDPASGIVLPAGRRVWRVPNPAGGSIPALRDGRLPPPLLIENAMLIVPSYHPAGMNNTAGFYAVALGNGQNPQVIQSGNPSSTQPWYLPRSGLGNPWSWLTPAIGGLVPNRGRGGGNDIVIYFGARREFSSGTSTIDGVQSFWIGVRGEVLTPEIAPDGTYRGYLRTRLTGQARIFVPPRSDPALAALRPRVYRYDNGTGILEDITGSVSFSDEEVGGSLPSASVIYNESIDIDRYRFFIDYYIDWTSVGNVNTMFRTFAQLPAGSAGGVVPPNELKGITLGTDGVVYITTGTANTQPDEANGNLIALMEQAPPRGQPRGGSVVLWRWQSHGGYLQPMRGGEMVPIDGATLWQEPNAMVDNRLGRFAQFNHSLNRNHRAMNFTFKHAPVYYDGAVYAIGEGIVRLGPVELPYTILLVFDADQNHFSIDLTAPITSGANIQLSQRDYARSGTNPSVNVSSIVSHSEGNPNPLISVDYNRGQIRFNGFAQSSAGGMINLIDGVLSISQPVVLSIGTESPILVRPDRVEGSWNNLRWYAVLFGTQAQGAPVVIGDNVYLPVVVRFPVPPNTRPRSGILALGADPYRLQPNLKARNAQAGMIPSQDYRSIIRWPYIDDLTLDPSDPFVFLREFITRFAENLQLGEQITPIVAGEGSLVVGSAVGMVAYSRQGTVIADEGRILEVDSAGRVVWSTENTQLEIPAGVLVPSKAKYALTPNARLYRYTENELLVVEPERNRVAIIDRAGYEMRTITRFLPDVVPQYDANGRIIGKIELRDPSRSPHSNYVSGTPDTLRNPTDVTVWTEFVPKDRNPYFYRLPLEFWIHYTISDAGNQRVVDIVDRYQVYPDTFEIGPPVQHPQLGAMLGVLYWMTPSTILGRQYKYVSAQRFEYWDGQQTRVGFATVVQNVAVEGSLTQDGGDPSTDPATPEAGMVTIELADRTIYLRRMKLPDGRIVPILAPSAIDTARRSATGRGNAGLYLLLTTSTGIYELQIPTTGAITDTALVSWMLPNEAYSTALRRRFEGLDLVVGSDNLPVQPILFKPRQARYLFNGNVLIVNEYSGITLVNSNNQQEERFFPGEVFEIKADDYQDTNPTDGTYGFKPSSILWSTADRPALSGTSQLRKPSSADRGF